MHPTCVQPQPSRYSAQLDIFSEPHQPTALTPASPTDQVPAPGPLRIEVVKPKKRTDQNKPGDASKKNDAVTQRAKPFGEDRFYDVLFQFESYSESQALTKKEFNEAEALDPHNPAEEESERHLQAVQRLTNALMTRHAQNGDDEAAEEDQHIVDVFTIAPKDTSAQRLAKAMFSRMIFDLVVLTPTSADVLEEAGLDLFGQRQIKNCKRDYAEMRKFDALIWIFNLSPDVPQISLDWVCEQLGFNTERIQRIVARSVKKDLRQLLRFIAGLTSADHANACQLALADYVDLASWDKFSNHS